MANTCVDDFIERAVDLKKDGNIYANYDRLVQVFVSITRLLSNIPSKIV